MPRINVGKMVRRRRPGREATPSSRLLSSKGPKTRSRRSSRESLKAVRNVFNRLGLTWLFRRICVDLVYHFIAVTCRSVSGMVSRRLLRVSVGFCFSVSFLFSFLRRLEDSLDAGHVIVTDIPYRPPSRSRYSTVLDGSLFGWSDTDLPRPPHPCMLEFDIRNLTAQLEPAINLADNLPEEALMALYDGRVAAGQLAAVDELKISLVISHCSRSLEWLHDYIGETQLHAITVISKCGSEVDPAWLPLGKDGSTLAKIMTLPNTGRCDHTMAYWMARMPPPADANELVVFLKDSLDYQMGEANAKMGTRSLPEVLTIAKNRGFGCVRSPVPGISAFHITDEIDGFHLDTYKGGMPIKNSNKGFQNSNLANLGAWKEMLGLSEYLTRPLMPVCYGGMYAVQKRRIAEIPRSVWSRLEESLLRGDNIIEGHYAERIWAGLLSEPVAPNHVRQLLDVSRYMINRYNSVVGALSAGNAETGNAETWTFCFWAENDWSELSAAAKKVAAMLSYDKYTWDTSGNVPLHATNYKDLPKSLQKAANFLGITSKHWDQRRRRAKKARKWEQRKQSIYWFPNNGNGCVLFTPWMASPAHAPYPFTTFHDCCAAHRYHADTRPVNEPATWPGDVITHTNEDFESGTGRLDGLGLPWIHGGTKTHEADWHLTDHDRRSGKNSMRSGNLNNKQGKSSDVTLLTSSSHGARVMFWYRASVGMPFDTFEFKLDGVLKHIILDHSEEWKKYQIGIEPGYHEISFHLASRKPLPSFGRQKEYFGTGVVYIDDFEIIPTSRWYLANGL